jgi:hypothetical protein
MARAKNHSQVLQSINARNAMELVSAVVMFVAAPGRSNRRCRMAIEIVISKSP